MTARPVSPGEPRPLTDMDRGAIAVLDLLKRGMEYAMGEETIEETAETIREGIAADGLPVVIRREYDYERENFPADERDAFPADLKALIKGVPKTVWK